MDAVLREAERLVALDPTFENQTALDRARGAAGYVMRYIICTRCKPGNPYVKSHRRMTLCDECGGQGWTDVEWIAPSGV